MISNYNYFATILFCCIIFNARIENFIIHELSHVYPSIGYDYERHITSKYGSTNIALDAALCIVYVTYFVTMVLPAILKEIFNVNAYKKKIIVLHNN